MTGLPLVTKVYTDSLFPGFDTYGYDGNSILPPVSRLHSSTSVAAGRGAKGACAPGGTVQGRHLEGQNVEF